MSERSNVFPLFLTTEFYLAIVDVQHEKRIGKAAAILYVINEGLRKLGFINEEIYELYEQRYGTDLLENVKRNRQKKAAKAKLRCMWAAGSSTERCRRLAVVKMEKDDKVAGVCPGHIKQFVEAGFKVVPERDET